MKKLTGLVRQAQTNDLGAYNQIVRRFQDMAVTYAYSLLAAAQILAGRVIYQKVTIQFMNFT